MNLDDYVLGDDLEPVVNRKRRTASDLYKEVANEVARIYKTLNYEADDAFLAIDDEVSGSDQNIIAALKTLVPTLPGPMREFYQRLL